MVLLMRFASDPRKSSSVVCRIAENSVWLQQMTLYVAAHLCDVKSVSVQACIHLLWYHQMALSKVHSKSSCAGLHPHGDGLCRGAGNGVLEFVSSNPGSLSSMVKTGQDQSLAVLEVSE